MTVRLPTSLAAKAKLGDYSQTPATGVPSPGTASSLSVKEAGVGAEAQKRAFTQSLLERGPSEVIDLTKVIYNPTVDMDVISYTVPSGAVAAIREMGVWYSEPLIGMCEALAWQLRVSNLPIPNLRDLNSPNGYHFPSGDIFNPMKITTVWIQGRQTVTLRLHVVYLFDEQVTIAARLCGRLYQTMAPLIRGMEE